MQAYDTIRTQLLEKQEVLRGRVSAIKRDRRQVDGPLNADWQEQAVDLENAEVLDHLDAEGRGEMAKIAAALQRLDAGTYGLCSSCNRKIPEGRLRALPYATQCMKCAT